MLACRIHAKDDLRVRDRLGHCCTAADVGVARAALQALSRLGPVAGNQWHTLRVEFAGKGIRVMLDGKRYIELDDEHIGGVGSVGVWTKADSITAFDDFAYGATGAR